MAKVLYLECNMGAAGDMIGAALYELLTEEQKKEFIHLVNDHCLADVQVVPEPSVKCGVQGTHLNVFIHGTEELAEDVHEKDYEHSHEHNHEHGHSHEHNQEHSHDHDHGHSHDHNHDHEHHHGHAHHHASLHEVHELIRACDVPENVKKDAMKVYDLLAKAESNAHGVEVSEIHFHEVGMKDAVTDVVNSCLLLSMIQPDKVVVSPINTGFGRVRCAHGILPVPAPATAYLLQGAPVYAGNIEGEMCTPTGAALLQFIKTEFNKMPIMNIEKTGYGMGKKDFAQANCVRAFLGEEFGTSLGDTDSIIELSCNLDDMTGEELGFAAQILREQGALEVFFTPAQMKKDRPGYLLTCLCKSDDSDKMATLILKYTSSWGVRKKICERYVMERHTETVDTKYGPVRIRCGEGYGVSKWKPEYDDVAKIAKENNISINTVLKELGK